MCNCSCGMWNFLDQVEPVPRLAEQILIHWAIREGPDSLLYNKKFIWTLSRFLAGCFWNLGISSVTGNDLTHGRRLESFHAGDNSHQKGPIWWLRLAGRHNINPSSGLLGWGRAEGLEVSVTTTYWLKSALFIVTKNPSENSGHWSTSGWDTQWCTGQVRHPDSQGEGMGSVVTPRPCSLDVLSFDPFFLIYISLLWKKI